MDIFCAILLAIAIQTTLCNKMPNPIYKWVSPTYDDKCKNIKCSSVEDPRCVKIIHQLGVKKTMYIIVLNKCEINYIKCHEDYAAKIVPMKQCHEEIHSTMKFNKTRRVRVKRGVKRDNKRFGGGDSDYSEYEDEGGHKICISRNIKIKGGKKKHSSASDSSAGFVAGYKVHDIYDEDETCLLNRNKSSTDVEHTDNSEANDEPGIEHETEFPLLSKESMNSKKESSEHQDTQDQGNCPDSCPSHSVMVCAKCQHGVYKTFVSVCHMKKFACIHPEEAILLISRYPCIMSAPFLSEKSMAIRGYVDEPNDDEKILNFFKCRDLGRLKGNDPRCKFE